ncbi:MAG: hypothetical protein AAGB48_03425 [Planctomycetota bacterium]
MNDDSRLMYSPNGSERVIALDGFPAPEPNAPSVRLIATDYRWSLRYVMHDVGSWALIGGTGLIVLGGPNDEALDEHALARFGLGESPFAEVVGSSWVGPATGLRLRHFVCTFKDSAFHVLSNDMFRLLGEDLNAKDADLLLETWLNG